MTVIGEAEFHIKDRWGRGLRLTETAQVSLNTAMANLAALALVNEALKEVV